VLSLRTSVITTVTVACVIATATPGLASHGSGANPVRGAAAREQALHALQHAHAKAFARQDDDGGGDDDVADQAEQYANERSAPADSVSGQALVAARRQAAGLPTQGHAWTQLTTKPYNAEPKNYKDQFWSNKGAGFGIVGGRTTALASDGRYWYAGAADGGVWRSTNRGKTWTPIFDKMPTLSIGAITVNPVDHSVWVGTGEANTNSDSYQGTGVYRSTNHGATFSRVGGRALVSALTFRIAFDGQGGVYAATSTGLYKTTANGAGAWKTVLQPDASQSFPPYTNQITDVAVRPGTAGKTVLAVDGWRNGSSFNGFYLSTDGGATFHEITPSGAIDTSDIGRTTLAYAADGSRLYAIIESPAKLLANDASNLQGVYVSASGNPAGPYTLIADGTKLENSGSALTAANSPGYEVGIQSWYNQVLAVDPHNPDHVVVSLEEAFETTNGGQTFTTASPYWNFGLACGTTCPKTTHPDQHAAMFAGNQVVIGNDGGVYRRPASRTGYGGWTDLNAHYQTLQYYDAAQGRLRKGIGTWGGLQDNGTSFLNSRAAQQVEPAGGDGGTVIVNPKNANKMVGEYTNLTMYSTDDGGKTFLPTIGPSCVAQEIAGYEPFTGCDPNARFTAPFVADEHNVKHWVAGGQYIWDSTKGWNTRCQPNGCDWKNVYDTGDGNSVTALSDNGRTTYAAWVAAGGNPGPGFGVGIATNAGGSWHEANMAGLPQRYISGVEVDPKDSRRVYAVFNGYSRRWIPGGGVGTVFVSNDAGKHWRNISGNLPDAPGDALVVAHGKLVLATDIGVFVAPQSASPSWKRLGIGLPHSSVNDIRFGPDNTLTAATHGRGIWTYQLR
jgi:hypothetical protein